MRPTYTIPEMSLADTRAWLGHVGVRNATSREKAQAIVAGLNPIELQNVAMALEIVESQIRADRDAAQVETCPRCRQRAHRHSPDHTKEGQT